MLPPDSFVLPSQKKHNIQSNQTGISGFAYNAPRALRKTFDAVYTKRISCGPLINKLRQRDVSTWKVMYGQNKYMYARDYVLSHPDEYGSAGKFFIHLSNRLSELGECVFRLAGLSSRLVGATVPKSLRVLSWASRGIRAIEKQFEQELKLDSHHPDLTTLSNLFKEKDVKTRVFELLSHKGFVYKNSNFDMPAMFDPKTGTLNSKFNALCKKQNALLILDENNPDHQELRGILDSPNVESNLPFDRPTLSALKLLRSPFFLEILKKTNKANSISATKSLGSRLAFGVGCALTTAFYTAVYFGINSRIPDAVSVFVPRTFGYLSCSLYLMGFILGTATVIGTRLAKSHIGLVSNSKKPVDDNFTNYKALPELFGHCLHSLRNSKSKKYRNATRLQSHQEFSEHQKAELRSAYWLSSSKSNTNSFSVSVAKASNVVDIATDIFFSLDRMVGQSVSGVLRNYVFSYEGTITDPATNITYRDKGGKARKAFTSIMGETGAHSFGMTIGCGAWASIWTALNTVVPAIDQTIPVAIGIGFASVSAVGWLGSSALELLARTTSRLPENSTKKHENQISSKSYLMHQTSPPNGVYDPNQPYNIQEQG